MSKYKKIISKILSGQSDSNILFEDLLNLLINLGFEVRVRGSHHLFHKAGVMEKINL
jgi:hypothetical protein